MSTFPHLSSPEVAPSASVLSGASPSTSHTADAPAPTSPETAAEKWERVAFGWCKVATTLLLTAPLGKYALPVVALLTAGLFVGAHVKGTRESRCILKRPLLIAAFWGVIGGALLWWRIVKG